MKRESLTHIINEWDPIGLISFSPQDEYLPEIKKIEELLQNCDIVDEKYLANGIKQIFTDSFGSNLFKGQFDECVNIAKKILDIFPKEKAINKIL